ncbi:HEPN domain-containing protein [Candidatus Pacearchaeota archaeon]|nr:HEPN domain-containing protein [Candidatus Pacearchaeota archaeon]
MVSLRWCCNQKDGIKLIESNANLAKGYLKMAEDSLGTMSRERKYNLRSAVSACYYSMYYSLYAVCMKIGIKCEIHSCTLEFMKRMLNELYSLEDIRDIKKAFDARNIAQYYIDKNVLKEDSDYIIEKAPLFFEKTKEILAKINEKDTEKIREKLRHPI